MTNHYAIFGLVVRSWLALPGHPVSPTDPDVVIADRSVPLECVDEDGRSVIVDEEAIFIRIPGVARIAVRDGWRIDVDAVQDTSHDDLRSYLVGSILGVLLLQRGAFVLHGSVATRNGHGVLVLGDRGSGKSTLVASMIDEGWHVVADDKAVVELEERAEVRSGPPIVKLAPESASQLETSLAPDSTVLDTGKRIYRVPTHSEPCTIDRIYCLAETDGPPSVESLPPAERVGHLLGDLYQTWIVSAMGDHGPRFEDCAAVARQVPVKRLGYPRRMDTLTATHRCIERDLPNAT